MSNEFIYDEVVTSDKTSTLFTLLTGLCFSLFVWSIYTTNGTFIIALFAGLFIFFLFYTLNYRKLEITLTTRSLTLKFGIIKWKITLKDITACELGKLPLILRLGGAGIHFMFVNGKYLASFNFLEHPRILIAFKDQSRLVKGLYFSTQEPEILLDKINKLIANNESKQYF